MKRVFGYALLLVLFAAPAFAGNKSQRVTIGSPVQIGSTQVAAGDYQLSWTGTGSNVQVTLAKNNKTVVTFPATATEGASTRGMETMTKGTVSTLQVLHLDKISFTVTAGTQSGQ